MKKLMILGFCAVMAMSATSCKKDWTCTCKDSGGEETFTIYKTNKATAKIGCDLSQGKDVTCTLK